MKKGARENRPNEWRIYGHLRECFRFFVSPVAFGAFWSLHEVDEGALRFHSAESLERECFLCPRCRRLARPNVWFCHDKNYNVSKASIQPLGYELVIVLSFLFAFWKKLGLVERPYSHMRHFSRKTGHFSGFSKQLRHGNAYNKWLFDLQERQQNLVVIECGGGLAIPSVRVQSEDAVEGAGKDSLLVRLNPVHCKVPERGLGIPLGSMEGLQRIDAELASLRKKGSPAKAKKPSVKKWLDTFHPAFL